MKLEKRTAALLAGASILLVVILALPSPHESGEAASPAPAHPPQSDDPRPAGEAAAEDATLLAQRRRARELTWTRDPFALASARTSVPSTSTEPVPALGVLPAPLLTGVSISEDARRAVIDRQIVQEGDRLPSGYTVARISARSVTLLRDREELTLRLGEER